MIERTELIIGVLFVLWLTIIFIVCPKVDRNTEDIEELKNKVEQIMPTLR